MLYDPQYSEKGALLCAAKAPRKPEAGDYAASLAAPVIITPHALPMFREEPGGEKKRAAMERKAAAKRQASVWGGGGGRAG